MYMRRIHLLLTTYLHTFQGHSYNVKLGKNSSVSLFISRERDETRSATTWHIHQREKRHIHFNQWDHRWKNVSPRILDVILSEQGSPKEQTHTTEKNTWIYKLKSLALTRINVNRKPCRMAHTCSFRTLSLLYLFKS